MNNVIAVNISVFISTILTSKSETEFKKDEMSRECDTHMEEEFVKNFGGKARK
jgi:hypothetical protein